MEFHAESFREIDEKAKYWLTISLPSFVGILGYGFQQGTSLSLYLVVIFSSISACLFVAIFHLAATLSSVAVEGGVLLPGSPGSREFSDVGYFLESAEHWLELEEDQAKEMLKAAASNEMQNTRKSVHLKRGELLLFRGVPTAVGLAACATFGYTSACPTGLATTSTGVIAGIGIGACVAAAFAVFAHVRTSFTGQGK